MLIFNVFITIQISTGCFMGTLTLRTLTIEKLFIWSNKEKSPLKVGLKVVYLGDAAGNRIYFSLKSTYLRQSMSM